MKLLHISEPELEFGTSIHICPRKGITDYQSYDTKIRHRRRDILLGVVGTSDNIEKFNSWVEICKDYIPAKQNNKQPNLYTSFCGFNERTGFNATIITDSELSKTLSNLEIKTILSIENWEKRLQECAEIYYNNIKYLSLEKGVDAIICIIPKKLESKIMKQTLQPIEEPLEEQKQDFSLETDFRRLLKAKCMHLGKPLQLILEDSLQSYREKSSRQDDATKAWNFCTALYYKTNHIPWRMIKDSSKPSVCYIGISFYRSRDRQYIHTSLAQLFDDLGNGVILRGSPVEISEIDRQPHLEEEQSYILIQNVLKEYEIVHGNLPARVVIHKTSNYNDQEISGFTEAISSLRIGSSDYVTILESNTKLFREGLYPPLRGISIELDAANHLLFTKGSIDFYQTYPGPYIPRPIEVRINENSDSSSKIILEELMSLTKMNWNNTQFDGKYPITIGCARKVGLIMKYISINEKPQTKYSFYM